MSATPGPLDWLRPSVRSPSQSLLLLGAVALVLTGTPLLGVLLAGQPLAPYLSFPPRPLAVAQPGFSWPMFAAFAMLGLAALAAALLCFAAGRGATKPPRAPRRAPFPWWGWLGLALTLLSWVLAWTRFPWFEPWQRHTFTPLWLGYVLVVNALSERRAGACLLTARPAFFLALFPLSALFWWFFEYLNRFVQNWHYVGVERFSALEYVAFASLAFSTVLPAVVSTTDLLASFPRLAGPLAGRACFGAWRPRLLGALAATVLALGLSALAVWPAYLFPLVWIAPLAMVLGLQKASALPTPLDEVAGGDWRPVCLPALAALVCGLFWELWNHRSLAHWEYVIPYVDRYHLFEMPLLGYLGYLPFGVECIIAASLLPGLHREARGRASHRGPR